MSTNETLTAAIEVRDQASADLQRLAQSFRSVAESALDAAEGSLVAAEGFDEAGDEASSLSRSLQSISGSASPAGATLEGVGTAAATASEGIDEAGEEARELNQRLWGTVGAASAASASLAGLGATASGFEVSDFGNVFESADVSEVFDTDVDDIESKAEVDVEGVGASRERLNTLQRTLSYFDGRTATAEADVDTDGERRLSTVRNLLTDIDGDISEAEVETDVDGQSRLSTLHRLLNAVDGRESESEVDVDVEGTEESRSRLSSLQRSIRYLDGRSADMDVDVDGVSRTKASLASVSQAADVVDGREVDIDVDADRELGMAGLRIPDIDIPNPIERMRERMRQSDLDLSTQFSPDGIRGILQQFDPAARNIDESEIVEYRSELLEVADAIDGLPTARMDIEGEEDLELFANQLREANRAGQRLSSTFAEMDDDTADHILRESDSIDTLRRKLRGTRIDTERTEVALEGLEESGRDVVNGMLAGAESADEFDDQLGDVGERATSTAALLKGLDGQLKSHITQTSIAAKTTDELSDEIREVGNAAIVSRLKTEAMDRRFGGLQETLQNTTTSIGGFRTSLWNVMQMLPAVISLVTVLGGALTTGLAGGLGIAGIFAGGALGAGEQMADQMERTASATGDSSQQMQQLEDASSGAERAMIGLQEILSRVRDAAFEAMEPLRQPEFAEFFMKGLDQVITLLSEFAQVVAWGSDELMGTVEVIGAAWWDTYPEFMDELVNLMSVFGPYLEDIAIGAIEALPGILAMMAEHGRVLMPLLMDFGSALIDLMPMLLEIGTLILRGILPNLTGLIEGFTMVAPLIRFIARVLGDLIATVDPLVRLLFRLGGAAIALNAIVPFLTLSFQALRLMMVYLVKIPILKFFASIKAVIGLAITAVTKLTAAFGVLGLGIAAVTGVGLIAFLAAGLTYFNLWDEAIRTLVKTWNKFISILELGQQIAGTIAETIVNGIIGGVNAVIKKSNDVLNTNYDTIEHEYEADEVGDGPVGKVDEDWGQGAAERLNSPFGPGGGVTGATEMVPNPSGQQQFSDSGSYQPRSQRDTGTSENRPYTNIENVNVNATGDTDEKRIEDAVRQGVRQANKRNRRRTSPMN